MPLNQRGERNHNAKLTAEQVAYMRTQWDAYLAAKKRVRIRAWAEELRVNPETIRRILRRERWT